MENVRQAWLLLGFRPASLTVHDRHWWQPIYRGDTGRRRRCCRCACCHDPFARATWPVLVNICRVTPLLWAAVIPGKKPLDLEGRIVNSEKRILTDLLGLQTSWPLMICFLPIFGRSQLCMGHHQLTDCHYCQTCMVRWCHAGGWWQLLTAIKWVMKAFGSMDCNKGAKYKALSC